MTENFYDKECVVYKCVVEKSVEDFDDWVDKAVSEYGHSAFTLVGAPTSDREYKVHIFERLAELLFL